MAQPLRHALISIRPGGKWLLALLPALILGWLLVPLVAAAHAQQVRSNPAPGSLIDSSPPYIQIEWSEAVSLNFSSIKVYDRERNEQKIGATGRPAGQDTVLKASLARPLGPGTYTVVWRVVSATDGHVTAGNFAFRIKGGSETAPITPDSIVAANDTGEDTSPLRWLVRAVILAGAAFLLGGALFTIGVVGPSAAKHGEAGARLKPVLRSGFARVGVLTAGVVVLALLLDLAGQVMAIRNSDLLTALGDSKGAWELISTTLYGFGWVIKLGAAVAFFTIMLFVWLKPAGKSMQLRLSPWALTAAAGALLFLGEGISSHAAAIHSDTGHASAGEHTGDAQGLGLSLPVLSDWLHLASVSLWVGGLGYMALVLFPGFRSADFSGEERRGFLRKAISRFSRLALVSVALIAVTGTYNVLAHSTDPGILLASAYGQVVAVKVAVFMVLVGIGAINLLRLRPRLRGQASNPGTDTDMHLLRNVRAEVALTAVALVCAAGLTLLPPPVTTLSTSDSAGRPTPAQTTVSTKVDGYALKLTIQPAVSGDKLLLDIAEAEGATPLTDVRKVFFRVRVLDVGSGNVAYTAEQVGPQSPDKGTWQITQPILTITGGYIVTCVVERTQSPDLQAAFRLDLSDTGLKAAPTAVETPGP